MTSLLTLLTDSTGTLLFFLIAFVLNQAAFFIALGQRMRGEQERTAGRYAWAAAGVILTWITLMIGALVVLILGIPAHQMMPPLEQAVILGVMVWVGWGFATADSPVGERVLNIVFIGAGTAVIANLIFNLLFWSPNAISTGFNSSAFGVMWMIGGVTVAAINTGLLMSRMRMVIDAPLKIIFFVGLGLGFGYSLFLNFNGSLDGDELGAVRLMLLIGLPLWPVSIYRFVVQRLTRLAEENYLRARVQLAPNGVTAVTTSDSGSSSDKPEAVAVLKALGSMIEREAPSDIPIQIAKATAAALRADVVALYAMDDSEFADPLSAYDHTNQKMINALAIKIDEQPGLIGVMESKDQRILRTDRNLNELVDLYTRLDIQRVGPAYYQALVKDGRVVAAMIVALPYTQRELRENEMTLLTALAPIAARLVVISRAALRSQSEGEQRAIEEMIAAADDPKLIASVAARAELQATLEDSRSQIGDLTNRVKELQIELDYERGRLAPLGEDGEGITERINLLAMERANLASERERLAQAVQEAQTRLISAGGDGADVLQAMVETLQKERDDLQTQKRQLEGQLEEIRLRGATVPPPAVLRKVLTNLSEEKARLQDERDRLSTQLTEMEGEMKALGISGAAGLASVIAQLTEERAHYKIVAERALSDRELFLEERRRLSEQLAAESEREKKMDALEKALRRLAADREALMTQRDQLRNAFSAQQTEVDRWQAERARFIAESEAIQDELQSLTFERQQVQAEVSRLLEALTLAEKERDQLIAERTAILTERDQLSAAAQGGRELLQRLGADGLDTLKGMIDSLTEERSELEHKLLRSQKQIDSLKDALTKAKDKLEKSIPLPEKSSLNPSQTEVMVSIAQELRTPMSSIIGYVDLLLGESVGILGASQRQFLGRVRSNADRLNSLLENFIKVTALDTGSLQLDPIKLDMIEIIDDTITSTRTQFREKGITLKIDVPDQMPELYGDRDALSQIMIQLLSNAYLASPTDGMVGITAKATRGVRPPGHPDEQLDGILITVRDQGGGISPEDQVRVFSRLYRADNPLISGMGDTGVGLSIARALTEMHGGRIWVESQLGVGSTFKVILPIQRDGEAPTQPYQPLSSQSPTVEA